MQRICLISCFIGKLPDYLIYFTGSCKNNPDVDFLVLNDSIKNSYSDGNIRFQKADLNEISNLISEKLKTGIRLQSAWKLNEVKPLFGLLFQEELKRYDFWGWCDIDIVWGNIRNFLNDKTLNSYDIITTKKNWTAGHFVLFRNNETTRYLFNRNKKIIELLNSEKYLAFEESCHRWNGEIFSPEYLEQNSMPVSMFDIVKDAEKKGEARCRFEDIIREHPQPVNYVYRNKQLFDLTTGQEFMYYHLITVKKIWRFYIPEYSTFPTEIYFTPYGIRNSATPVAIWFLCRAFSCAKGIVKSVSKQSAGTVAKKLFSLLTSKK